MKIVYLHDTETFRYAASELAKYVRLVTDKAEKCTCAYADKPEEDAVTLGLLDELGCPEKKEYDPVIDDVVDVKIKDCKGYIAGSNARSVLFGVYDYLKSAGCAWVRPGPLGEKIGRCDLSHHSFSMRHRADEPFRVEMFEGAVKYEHVRAAIEFLPKIHANGYYIQGVAPYNFMSRWYLHKKSTCRPSEDIGYEGVEALTALMEKDVLRCGLQLHSMGHGYQTRPYGIIFRTSYEEYEMNDRMENALALVDGKRAFRGSPNWSQLCMGNDEVLRDQVAWLADYLEKKPYITYIVIYLGDGANNHCECEKCRPHHPSDLYVKMLNMLDAELTKRGVGTRIKFGSYVDTLWTPRVEKFNNKDRFLLGIAIGGRDYKDPYDDSPCDDPIPEWHRNRFNVPPYFPLRRKMFAEWQKFFGGMSIATDYQFYSAHYSDPGYAEVSKNYYEDLHFLPKLGFSGSNACKTQRCSFPTALPTVLNGEVLYDLSRSYDDIKNEYMKNAFGKDFAFACEYLETVTRLFDPKSLRVVDSIDTGGAVAEKAKPYNFRVDPAARARLESIPAALDAYKDRIDENAKNSAGAEKRSWELLSFHVEYCKRLAAVYALGASGGDIEEARRECGRFADWLSHNEDFYEYDLDYCLCMTALEKNLK